MEESPTVSHTERWLPWLLLTVLCALAFFVALGSIHLIDVDEPRYAEAAREMIATGNWLTPHFNYKPRFDKPALFYWLIALADLVFGINEFAARFWSAALASGLVFFLYGAMRRDLGRRPALAAAVVLATSLQFLALGRLAITDMALTAFIGAAAIALYRTLTAEGTSSRPWALAAYVFMSLAVLTKGPVGLVLPVAGAGLFLFWRRRLREDLRKLDLRLGVVLFSLLTFPWYLLMVAVNGRAFVDSFFVHHNLERYLHVTSGHGGSYFYYLPVILLGFLPWTFFLPEAVWRVVKRVPASHSLPGRGAATIYWILLGGATLLFYSFSRSKLPTYITPVYLSLAVLTGMAWARSLEPPAEFSRGLRIESFVTAGFLLATAVVLIVAPLFLSRVRAAIDPQTGKPLALGNGPALLAVGLLAAGGVLLAAARRRRAPLCFGAVAVSVPAVILIALFTVARPIDNFRQGRLDELAKMAGRDAGPGDTIATYGLRKTGVVFYSRHPVREVGQGDLKRLETLSEKSPRLWVLTRLAYYPELVRSDHFLILRQDAPYVLVVSLPKIPAPERTQ